MQGEETKDKNNSSYASENEDSPEEKNTDEKNPSDAEGEHPSDLNEQSIVPEYRLTETWSIKPIDQASEKVVLITIDDVPDQHAVEMAKTLKKHDVPAIFFVNGIFIEA